MPDCTPRVQAPSSLPCRSDRATVHAQRAAGTSLVPPADCGWAVAGIGKSALVNHLAQEDVSEVLHGSVGSVGPVECTINCSGLDWRVVDIPGCNGLHLNKKLLSREVGLVYVGGCGRV